MPWLMTVGLFNDERLSKDEYDFYDILLKLKVQKFTQRSQRIEILG